MWDPIIAMARWLNEDLTEFDNSIDGSPFHRLLVTGERATGALRLEPGYPDFDLCFCVLERVRYLLAITTYTIILYSLLSLVVNVDDE